MYFLPKTALFWIILACCTVSLEDECKRKSPILSPSTKVISRCNAIASLSVQPHGNGKVIKNLVLQPDTKKKIEKYFQLLLKFSITNKTPTPILIRIKHVKMYYLFPVSGCFGCWNGPYGPILQRNGVIYCLQVTTFPLRINQSTTTKWKSALHLNCVDGGGR